MFEEFISTYGVTIIYGILSAAVTVTDNDLCGARPAASLDAGVDLISKKIVCLSDKIGSVERRRDVACTADAGQTFVVSYNIDFHGSVLTS